MTDHEGSPHGLTEREAEVYKLTVVNRLTQREIAERFDISQPAVSAILAKARAKLPPPDLGAIRQEAIALYEAVQREAWNLAGMEGAPVTAGKDGDLVLDPKTGEHVRDYQGRIMALRLALAAGEDLRKLMGADAATKTEVTGSVRYEVVGVNPEDLT